MCVAGEMFVVINVLLSVVPLKLWVVTEPWTAPWCRVNVVLAMVVAVVRCLGLSVVFALGLVMSVCLTCMMVEPMRGVGTKYAGGILKWFAMWLQRPSPVAQVLQVPELGVV